MAGLYYEEYEIGQVFKHETGRTIYDYDNILFSTLSMNPAPLHLDAEHAAKSQYGQTFSKQLIYTWIGDGTYCQRYDPGNNSRKSWF